MMVRYNSRAAKITHHDPSIQFALGENHSGRAYRGVVYPEPGEGGLML